MATVAFGEAIAILERDRCRPVLDLERDIGDRNPPGPTVRVTTYRKLGNGKVSTHHGTKEVGKAVLWSHNLEAYGCQCRHDLDTEARIERGVSGNNERSGKCPLTMKLTPGEIASFGQPLSRLSLAGRGLLDGDVPNLLKALQGNRTITELCLSSNTISNAGARHIAHYIAEHNRNLTDLDLADNSIGDTGAIALAESLRHNTTLLELSLDGNPIRQEGTHHLLSAVAANPFCHLTLPDYRAENSVKTEAFVKKGE